MGMPTYERRFFIGLLTRDMKQREEHMEQMQQKSTTKTGKGTRQSKVSGDALKHKIKTGEIPNK